MYAIMKVPYASWDKINQDSIWLSCDTVHKKKFWFIHRLTPLVQLCYKRVSMGLTDRRKTGQNLVDSRKNWKNLTVSRK